MEVMDAVDDVVVGQKPVEFIPVHADYFDVSTLNCT